ncbi:thiamine pyrophosphate-dependent enzyme, partial [Chloroflexota bacterium]
PNPEAKIVHIDIDPVKQDLPMWGFPVDVLIQADSSKALPVLNQIIQQRTTPEKQTLFQVNFRQLQSEHKKMRDEWYRVAMNKATYRPIAPEWLCHCISEIIDDETIVLEEAVTNFGMILRHIHRTKPGTFFSSGGSSLGWGLGAALGVKLASPESTVVTLVGDGSFIYGQPIPALWAANVYHAPFLTIIFNNKRYCALKSSLRMSYGGESYSEKTGVWVGVDIEPSPDYALISQACDAHGQIVEDPSDLQPAIINALKQVRQGKPAVLDVRIESP